MYILTSGASDKPGRVRIFVSAAICLILEFLLLLSWSSDAKLHITDSIYCATDFSIIFLIKILGEYHRAVFKVSNILILYYLLEDSFSSWIEKFNVSSIILSIYIPYVCSNNELKMSKIPIISNSERPSLFKFCIFEAMQIIFL